MRGWGYWRRRRLQPSRRYMEEAYRTVRDWRMGRVEVGDEGWRMERMQAGVWQASWLAGLLRCCGGCSQLILTDISIAQCLSQPYSLPTSGAAILARHRAPPSKTAAPARAALVTRLHVPWLMLSRSVGGGWR